MSKETIKKVKLIHHYNGIGIGDKILFNRYGKEYQKGTVVSFGLRRKKWGIFNKWKRVIIVRFASDVYECADFSDIIKYDWSKK